MTSQNNGRLDRTYSGADKMLTIIFQNFQIPSKFVTITLKSKITWFYHREMPPKDAEGIANSEYPDQTAPVGAV